MGKLVCGGAMLQCNFGSAPGSLNVLPKNRVTSSTPSANIMDNVAMVNVPALGTCSSLTNPVVASATAAAQGVLTPQPCTPVTPAPWAPGSSTVLIANMPALTNSCKLVCAWGGNIQIQSPNQETIETP